MTTLPPVGSTVRLNAYPDSTGTVFDHGVIDGEPVAYVHLHGGTNAALTPDRFSVIDRKD